MLQRTSKIFIGKDIDRDAQCIDGAPITTLIASTGLADGEVLVLDKNMKIAASDVDNEDTDVIYICQGTGETFNYTNEAGTAVTGARKIIVSNPIKGANVKSYTGKAYTAKAEKTASLTLTGMTPVVGTEYIVRIVYKDINEHPGQFTQTYRYVSTTATLDTFGAAIAAKINKHKGSRVTASYTDSTDVLLLTAKAIPECTTGLNDIDEFSMVDFTVYFNYVNNKGNWVTWPTTSAAVTYTGPTYGSGNWAQVRDMEKADLAYTGPSNKTKFPVQKPDMSTVVGGCYDIITIEHEADYLSPDNQYRKKAPLTTKIALATASTGTNAGNQSANIVARLNSYFGSYGHASINI